jgi:hypothetical protein
MPSQMENMGSAVGAARRLQYSKECCGIQASIGNAANLVGARVLVVACEHSVGKLQVMWYRSGVAFNAFTESTLRGTVLELMHATLVSMFSRGT